MQKTSKPLTWIILPKVMNIPPYIHCIYIVPLIRIDFKGDIISPNVNLCLKFLFLQVVCTGFSLLCLKNIFDLPHRNFNPLAQ